MLILENRRPSGGRDGRSLHPRAWTQRNRLELLYVRGKGKVLPGTSESSSGWTPPHNLDVERTGIPGTFPLATLPPRIRLYGGVRMESWGKVGGFGKVGTRGCHDARCYRAPCERGREFPERWRQHCRMLEKVGCLSNTSRKRPDDRSGTGNNEEGSASLRGAKRRPRSRCRLC